MSNAENFEGCLENTALFMLAEQGNAKAQLAVGNMYEYGEGVIKDGRTALKWYLKAAEQGDWYAQYLVGYGYENGYYGLEKDDDKAIEWYLMSAKTGYECAQRKVEWLCKDGQGKVFAVG